MWKIEVFVGLGCKIEILGTNKQTGQNRSSEMPLGILFIMEICSQLETELWHCQLLNFTMNLCLGTSRNGDDTMMQNQSSARCKVNLAQLFYLSLTALKCFFPYYLLLFFIWKTMMSRSKLLYVPIAIVTRRSGLA